MTKAIQTERLLIDDLNVSDAKFIRELVNTAGWIQFIGERNVHSLEDAKIYIEKIIENPQINYWAVRLPEVGTPIGVVTFIKRDYLLHHDIGFAFLPEYSGRGYAYEAAKALLDSIVKENTHKAIVATTLPDNISSIKLLEKLGLQFEKELEREDLKLLLYSSNISSNNE